MRDPDFATTETRTHNCLASFPVTPDPHRIVGPLLVGSVFAILLAATWGRWAELIVDFGRELYVPWRIAEGDVLYRDLAYFNGPLSPHINALLFRLLGPGIQILLLFNVVILILFTAAAYHILARLAGAIPAAVSCCAFLVLCAFAQHTTYGSYNFLAPYSHELTHGLLLSALGLLLLRRLGDGAVLPALGVGVCVGLTLLTKPEIALAAAVSLTVGTGLVVWVAGWPMITRFAVCGLFVMGVVLPAAGFAVAHTGHESAWIREALMSPWTAVVNADIRAIPFYRAGLGLHDPRGNLFSIGLWSGLWIAFIGGPYWIFRRLSARLQRRSTIGLWFFALTFLCASAAVIVADGFRAFGPLPVLMAILLLGLVADRPRWPGSFNRADRILAFSGLLFSLLLLAKMGLRPQVVWYGFALAAPALLAAIAWLFGLLPRRLDRGRGGAGTVIGSASAVLLAVVTLHVVASASQYERRSLTLGGGMDQLRVDEARAQAIGPALTALGRVLQPGETLLVVPEGVSINYLLRVKTPTPYFNFMPPELILFGEDRMISALEPSPPAFILFIPKWTDDYGGEFGKEFGVHLSEWIENHYGEIQVFPGGEFFGMPFNVRLLAPRSALDPP